MELQEPSNLPKNNHLTYISSAKETKILFGRYSGYMAPEYAMKGQFSVKTDVYSFGVLVLEIISGKKNNWSPG